MNELIILTGVSGAGKSTCLFAFEEMGYYCLENCPLPLISSLFDLISKESKYHRMVVAVNALDANKAITVAKSKPDLSVTSIFLDASEMELLSRYKLTRHVHPLQARGFTLVKAINIEKESMKDIKDIDIYLDTTGLSVTAVRKILFSRFSKTDSLTINFMSFGYKHGVPLDADVVFDMRILPNPYYIPELKTKTGQDKEVVDYLFEMPITHELVNHIKEYLNFYLPRIKEEGRSYFVVGIGCSGGQHRSVAIANYLKDQYSENYEAIVNHRDLVKANR